MYDILIKSIEFRATSLTDLRDFPRTAIREASFQLDKIQHGLAPEDAKPMPTIGSVVTKLRLWDEAGTFRVVYVAKFGDAVYVLHCFQKKTPQTAKKDIDLATQRYKALREEIAP